MQSQSLEVIGATADRDGTLSLKLRDNTGEQHAIRVGAHGQGLILQALLAGAMDPTSPAARVFEPAGVSRFRAEGDVGVSFLLSPLIAMHFVLDRSLAEALQELLRTFDEPGTWRRPKWN